MSFRGEAKALPSLFGYGRFPGGDCAMVGRPKIRFRPGLRREESLDANTRCRHPQACVAAECGHRAAVTDHFSAIRESLNRAGGY